MSTPRSAPACSSASVIRVSTSRLRTISPETACEALTTALTSNCSMGAPKVAVGGAGADSSRSCGWDCSRCAEPCRELVGQPLVLDETVLARQSDGLFIEAHRVHVPPVQACNLSTDQCRAVCESCG